MGLSTRQEKILGYLEQHGAVTVRTLTAELYVSEATVRRDLVELEKCGLLRRTFGGAIPARDANQQVPLFIREGMDSAVKNDLCRRASDYIHDGDTIFIDGSSTGNCLVKYLGRFRDLTVVTHSMRTAGLLSENHIRTCCTGGWLDETSMVFTGASALRFSESINTDLCFLSCKGMDAEGRFTDTSEMETAIRRNFLLGAKKRVFLMTENKFGATYRHTLCRSTEVDVIVTDGVLPDGIRLRGET